jgi:hypothetical protein
MLQKSVRGPLSKPFTSYSTENSVPTNEPCKQKLGIPVLISSQENLSAFHSFPLQKTQGLSREPASLIKCANSLEPKTFYETVKAENQMLKLRIRELEETCKYLGVHLMSQVSLMQKLVDQMQYSLQGQHTLATGQRKRDPQISAPVHSPDTPYAAKDHDHSEIARLRTQLKTASRADASGTHLRALSLAVHAAVRSARIHIGEADGPESAYSPAGIPAPVPSPLPGNRPPGRAAAVAASKKLEARSIFCSPPPAGDEDRVAADCGPTTPADVGSAEKDAGAGAGRREAEHLFFATPPLALRRSPVAARPPFTAASSAAAARQILKGRGVGRTCGGGGEGG